jgi:hypothetical protein
LCRGLVAPEECQQYFGWLAVVDLRPYFLSTEVSEHSVWARDHITGSSEYKDVSVPRRKRNSRARAQL